MNSKIHSKKNIESLCAEIGPEDGVNLRKFFNKQTNRRANRKAHQLCKQIQLTLNMTLSGELNDPALGNLIVDRVEPVPESSHLLIVFTFADALESFNPVETLQSLQKASGFLRAEAAKAIHRKRVPEFSFRLLNPKEVRQ